MIGRRVGGEDVKSAEVGTDKGRSGLPGGREESGTTQHCFKVQ